MTPTRRLLLQSAGGFALFGVAHAQAPQYEASIGADIVGARPFDTIAAAIAAFPGDAPLRIFLGEGTHREKLVVERPNVSLTGVGPTSVLSFDTAAGMRADDGRPWGTWRCATLSVRAPGFSARNITIENAFDYVADLATPQFERIGSNGAQAVAVMLAGECDRAVFQNVRITGHQDTLFTDAGRALFRNCFISGSVDFIFGAGAAYFDRCELQSRYRPLMQRNHGWLAAPSTKSADPFGLVFNRCRLTREAQVPPASVALGRPWRPTREFSDGRYGDPDVLGMAAFLHCWMGDHISADGWDEMGYTARDGSRVFLQPGEARLDEFASQGPGAFANRRRPQLRASVARAITETAVLRGWRAGE